MSKLKIKILDTIAWIAFIVGVIMVIWRVFGDSPTDLAVISPFIVFGLVKIWTNNERIWGLKMDMKHGFMKVKDSFDKVREDMNRIENKIDNLNKPRSKK